MAQQVDGRAGQAGKDVPRLRQVDGGGILGRGLQACDHRMIQQIGRIAGKGPPFIARGRSTGRGKAMGQRAGPVWPRPAAGLRRIDGGDDRLCDLRRVMPALHVPPRSGAPPGRIRRGTGVIDQLVQRAGQAAAFLRAQAAPRQQGDHLFIAVKAAHPFPQGRVRDDLLVGAEMGLQGCGLGGQILDPRGRRRNGLRWRLQRQGLVRAGCRAADGQGRGGPSRNADMAQIAQPRAQKIRMRGRCGQDRVMGQQDRVGGDLHLAKEPQDIHPVARRNLAQFGGKPDMHAALVRRQAVVADRAQRRLVPAFGQGVAQRRQDQAQPLMLGVVHAARQPQENLWLHVDNLWRVTIHYR